MTATQTVSDLERLRACGRGPLLLHLPDPRPRGAIGMMQFVDASDQELRLRRPLGRAEQARGRSYPPAEVWARRELPAFPPRDPHVSATPRQSSTARTSFRPFSRTR